MVFYEAHISGSKDLEQERFVVIVAREKVEIDTRDVRTNPEKGRGGVQRAWAVGGIERERRNKSSYG